MRAPASQGFGPDALSYMRVWITVDGRSLRKVAQLGIMPQVFALIARLGGYVSALTLIMGALFVKKYNRSGLVRANEILTLRGQESTEELLEISLPEDDPKNS